MSDKYFLKVNNKIYGPFTISKILNLFSSNKITKDSQVKKNNDNNWVKLSELSEFSVYQSNLQTIAIPGVQGINSNSEEDPNKTIAIPNLQNKGIDSEEADETIAISHLQEKSKDSDHTVAENPNAFIEPINEDSIKIFVPPPDPDSMEIIETHDIDDVWFINDQKRQIGPYTKDKAREILNSDKNLSKEAYAFKEGKEEVMLINNFEGDLKQFSSSKPTFFQRFSSSSSLKWIKIIIYALLGKNEFSTKTYLILVSTLLLSVALYIFLKPCPFGSKSIENHLKNVNPTAKNIKRNLSFHLVKCLPADLT